MRCLSLPVKLTSAPLALSHFSSSSPVSNTFYSWEHKFMPQIKQQPLWPLLKGFLYFNSILTHNLYLSIYALVISEDLHFSLTAFFILLLSFLSGCCDRHDAKYLRVELGLCRNKMLLLPCCHFSFLSFYRCNEEQRIHLAPSLSFLLSPIFRLSISLPPYRSSNPIRLLRLRESHSEDMAAHLIWTQINSSMSCEGMQTVYVFMHRKCVRIYKAGNKKSAAYY